ncbi:MAG: M24 family metallopeptidase [Pseudomonadota bacterium]
MSDRAALRLRLGNALAAQGIDAYIALTPANYRYITGHASAFLDLSWQMTGTDMAILPTDQGLAPAILVSDYSAPEASRNSDIEDVRTYSMWTENRAIQDLTATPARRIERPEQYDSRSIFGIAREVLADRGLSHAVIGTDLTQMKTSTMHAMHAALPNNRIVDCEETVYAVRSIKEPFEIDRLARAAALFDHGAEATFQALEPGQSAPELRGILDAAIREKAPECEATFFFPHFGMDGAVSRDALVKLDAGARVGGYWSDGCRHRVFGRPTAMQRRVHEALSSGYAAALEKIRPGALMRDVFQAGIDGVRKYGLPGYSRGHIGHSIGLDGQIEEAPFIGPNETQIKENMVLCLELPCYPPDLGGFNIEDMLLVTATSVRPLTHLSHRLAI